MDPIKAGENCYAYVNDDPINYIDRIGLEAAENRIETNAALVDKALGGDYSAWNQVQSKIKMGDIGIVRAAQEAEPILKIGPVTISGPDNGIWRYVDPPTGDVLGDQVFISARVPVVKISVNSEDTPLERLDEATRPGPKTDPNAPHNKKIREVAD